jgi:hypothetical protein
LPQTSTEATRYPRGRAFTMFSPQQARSPQRRPRAFQRSMATPRRSHWQMSKASNGFWRWNPMVKLLRSAISARFSL